MRWEHYGHCLDTHVKFNTIISVANATEIESKGTWTGTVQAGGTGALSCFEIFDCKDAFNVILGKPWLKAVRAQHDYVTDEIAIGADGEQEVLTNILNTSVTKTVTPPLNDVAIPNTPQQQETIETTADNQLSEEWARITQLGTSDKPQVETRWIGEDRNPDINQLMKIVQSETRIKLLKNHMDTLREMAKNRGETPEDTNKETTTVNAMGDVTKDEFKINRGSNTSARVMDTFGEV